MTPTRQVAVPSQPAKSHPHRRVGEVAGGATGKCAAVLCCCPFTVLNFIVLTVYTVPKGLLRKAVDRRRRRLNVKKSGGDGGGGRKNDNVRLRKQMSSSDFEAMVAPSLLEEHLANEAEAVELEQEMWARFNETGFFRSESRREPGL